MGTRGYYCYRFRGRLYVYYNHWDSYPSVLGRFLLENIPTDPENYEEWLSKMRAYYIELERVLDEKILTLPEPGTQVAYTTPRYEYNLRRSDPLSEWQFHVDERLERLPSYSEEPLNDLYIEWVYTIDLDRELVRIKHEWTESSFRLRSFPRQLGWAKDFQEEEQEEEEEEKEEEHREEEDEGEGEKNNNEGADEQPAQIPLGQPLVALLTPSAPSRSSMIKYDSLEVSKVKPRTLATLVSQGKHVYATRQLLFTHFIDKWSRTLANHILFCQSLDFIYREAVFAVLSLAAGEFQLLADQSPLLDGNDRLRERLGSPNGASIVPDFGSGMHIANVLPGSAPDSSFYWFKGVLVLLLDGLVTEQGFKAGIVTVTELAQESAQKTVDAIVTNLQSFMLVRVIGFTVVQHTDLIELVNHTTVPESERSFDSDPELRMASGNTSGFDVLMDFFDVVAAYTLKPFKSMAKRLPNELCDKIVEMVDLDTYLKCSDVSDTFRHYVQQHVRLSQQPTLASTPHESAIFSHHIIRGVSSGTSRLIVFDTVQGQEVESDLKPWNDGDIVPHWAPVIGRDQRKSMILSCAVTISALASHLLPVAKDHRPEMKDPDFASMVQGGNRSTHERLPFGLGFFSIPKFASIKFISFAWEDYLRFRLMKSPGGELSVPWSASPEAHRYLLPPNTGSIPLEPYMRLLRDEDGNQYSDVVGMIWLKKSIDFEVASVRERTLREAQDFLHAKAVDRLEDRRPKRQGFLVVAFGTKTQCFEWKFSDSASDIQPVLTALEDGAALDVYHSDERERFETLFGKMRDQAEASRKAAEISEGEDEDK